MAYFIITCTKPSYLHLPETIICELILSHVCYDIQHLVLVDTSGIDNLHYFLIKYQHTVCFPILAVIILFSTACTALYS